MREQERRGIYIDEGFIPKKAKNIEQPVKQVTVDEILNALNNPYNPDLREYVIKCIEARGIAPPDGYVIAPVEPTANMLIAWSGWREYDIPDHWCDELRPIYGGYRAMLSAVKE